MKRELEIARCGLVFQELFVCSKLLSPSANATSINLSIVKKNAFFLHKIIIKCC